MAQLVGAPSHTPKGCGLTPGQVHSGGNQSMSLSFSLSQIKKHIPGEDKKNLMTKNSQGSQRKPYYIIIFQWKHYKPGESGRKYSKY